MKYERLKECCEDQGYRNISLGNGAKRCFASQANEESLEDYKDCT